jgi:hypothetical protein
MPKCGCIQRIQDGMKQHYPDAEHMFIEREFLSGKTYSILEVHLPGKKKPKEVPIFHSRCPWCGEPYEAEQEAPNA